MNALHNTTFSSVPPHEPVDLPNLSLQSFEFMYLGVHRGRQPVFIWIAVYLTLSPALPVYFSDSISHSFLILLGRPSFILSYMNDSQNFKSPITILCHTFHPPPRPRTSLPYRPGTTSMRKVLPLRGPRARMSVLGIHLRVQNPVRLCQPSFQSPTYQRESLLD